MGTIMLRTESKWTLRGKKASYKKKSYFFLGVVGVYLEERPWPTLEKGTRARGWEYLEKKKSSKTDWTHNGSRRVRLPWACEPTARRCGLRAPMQSPPSPRNAPGRVARAPRAPLRPKHRAIRPFLRGSATSGARRAHWAAFPLQLLDCGRVRSSKSPDVKASPG